MADQVSGYKRVRLGTSPLGWKKLQLEVRENGACMVLGHLGYLTNTENTEFKDVRLCQRCGEKLYINEVK